MYRSMWKPGRRLGTALVGVTAVLVGGLGTVAGVGPALAAAAAPTLAAHWSLDEGSGGTAADSGGGGNTATLGSGASWAASGQVGASALNLNGTVNGVASTSGPVVDTSQSFTVSAWVKLNSTAGYQTAVSIDGTQVSGFFLQQRGDTGTFAFTRLGGDSTGAAGAVASATVVPTVGAWYHLVGVDDVASGTLRLYVDGQQQTDAAYSGQWKATGKTVIGRGLYGGNPADFVNGSVDDVQVYQGAMTTAQVQSVNTTARWGFDEGTGSTAADATGNGHTAALGSGASWVTPGRVGAHALALDGTPAGTATATGPTVDTGHSFSVAAWVKPGSVTGFQTAVSTDGGQVSGYYLQLRGDTGKFAFTRLASDSVAAAVSTVPSTSAPTAGQWYHLVGVDDTAAGRLSLYVNGVLQGSTGYTGDWTASGDTAIGRGRYAGAPADFFTGAVDDVQTFDHALTADEVQGVVGTAGGILSVNAGTPAHALPSTFFGVMTEDINHSGEGGLYAELLQNRSMMASATTPVSWSPVGDASIALDAANPLNTALTRSLAVSLTTATKSDRAGVANSGFWGVPVGASRSYTASFFAKASKGFTGALTVDVEGVDGTVYAKGSVTGVGTAWKQFKVTIKTGKTAPSTAAARFVLSAKSGSGTTLWLDNVSLFPQTYKNVKNGLRTDLMTKIAGLAPSFIREPGGNYLEGNTLATRFNWKASIGPVWTRPGHQDDAWGYWSTDGMGLLEYLEWAESLGAEPMLAVYAGYNLNNTHVPLDQLAPYVQDALDEIQYATGATSTVWGARRAADGHPAPFAVHYVEVGNEDFFDSSGSYDGANGRFTQFYDAIRKAYPAMKIIATADVSSRTPDVVDQHFYQSPAWMNTHADLFDTTSRTGPKIMVGEWAAQEGRPTPDLNAALGDASWLTGLERNSDLVTQEAYAPLLVNVNSVQWSTNLIGFDALTSYGSPSYYAQAMLGQNHGDQVLTASYSGVGGLNTVATKDSATGKIYLTVVNPGGSAQPVTVDLAGAGTVNTAGSMTVLSSAHPTDTNTISDPAHVVPVTSKVTGLGASFTRTFAAYSVTVITLN